MTISAYFHQISEKVLKPTYELGMSPVHKVIAQKNFKLRENNFFEVIDESKPSYLIVSSIYNRNIIVFDNHTTGKKSKGKINAKNWRGSDLEILLSVEDNSFEKRFGITIRRNNVAYSAGNMRLSDRTIREISFNDILDFVSGDISWEDLGVRSKEKTEESFYVSAEERLRINERKLLKMYEELRKIKLEKELLEEENNFFKNEIGKLRQQVRELCRRLRGIPDWMVNILSF